MIVIAVSDLIGLKKLLSSYIMAFNDTGSSVENEKGLKTRKLTTGCFQCTKQYGI